MNVARCDDVGHPGWLALRATLWPHCSRGQHLVAMTDQIAQPARYAAFVAHDDHGDAVGFAEASIRTDHVNGTDSSPVAFLEGLYVAPQARRNGCARGLVAAVASWGRACGCGEFASDASLANADSHAMHRALGFAETERVVFFRRTLR